MTARSKSSLTRDHPFKHRGLSVWINNDGELMMSGWGQGEGISPRDLAAIGAFLNATRRGGAK